MSRSIPFLPASHSQPRCWWPWPDAPVVRLPLMGTRVPAGFASPADDYIEGHLDLNELLIHHKAATFIMQLAPDAESLWDLGLRPGDYLVVDRSLEPRHGDVVLAAVSPDNVTAKQLYMKNGRRALVSRNEARKEEFPPIWITEEMELRGVVRSSFRDGRFARGGR